MPEDFSFQLYPDDLERLEWHIDDAMARVPLLGAGGREQGDQRPHTLCAGRLAAAWPDAWRAQCLRGLRLHLRHRAGRRRGQGAGRMDHRRRHRMGHVGLSIRAAIPTTRIPTTASPRGWRSMATNMPCISRAMNGPQGAIANSHPCMTAIRALGGVMGAYNGWERANWFARPGDDTSRSGHPDLEPRWPVGAPHPRGMRSRARRMRRPGPARIFPLQHAGARAQLIGLPAGSPASCRVSGVSASSISPMSAGGS